MVSFWRSAASNRLYVVKSGVTSASSNSPLCTHRSKKAAAWLFTMSLGPCAPTMDLSRPKAGVSCFQSRGSNGNHDMFAVASGTGGILLNVVKPPARRILRRGHLHETNTRSMVLHAEPSDRAAAAAEFRTTLSVLGIPQRRAAAWFDITARSFRRWVHNERRIPRSAIILVRLLGAKAITAAQVERVAGPVPARANGGAKGEPPVPLLVEPAPTPATLVRAEAATFADSDLTTAEKVIALAPGACRWPCGDPGHPDFHFCGDPVAKRPYCEHHRTMAYMAPRTGGGHSARIRLVAQWGHQWPKASCPKGTHHAAAPVALSVPPAGAPNRRSVR